MFAALDWKVRSCIKACNGWAKTSNDGKGTPFRAMPHNPTQGDSPRSIAFGAPVVHAANDKRIRLGIIRLTDTAPVVIAKELGFFAEEGLDVTLSVEPSWANVADKITYGHLDGAVMLPALAIAVSLGLRGAAAPLIVPLSLSLNGNTVTLSNEFAAGLEAGREGESPAALAKRLGAFIGARKRAGGSVPRIAVVHAFSTHNLLLRHWLAAGGISPGGDVLLPVLPPSQMAEALRSGEIDGFCAGAPWGEVALRAGAGRTAVTSRDIWNNHPEKVFALSRRFAERRPDAVPQLLRALLRAAQFCDNPQNNYEVAALLARRDYVGVHVDAIFASLPKPVPERSHGANRSVFFAHAASFPWPSHALWFLGELKRWGYVAADTPDEAATKLYRPDLYRSAAAGTGICVPIDNSKTEGTHATEWLLPAYPTAIAMAPDLFCDGTVFDPAASERTGFAPDPLTSAHAKR